MVINKFSQSHKCFKKHNIQGISLAGTEKYMVNTFHCKDCNKVRRVIYWYPKLFKSIKNLFKKQNDIPF